MKFNSNFVGYAKPGTVQRFLGGDSEELFNNNLKSQPNDWYYRFNEVTYDINRYGHRSKNIEDIDLDNYILFTGCSHTEGVGLELEKTFPYLIANDLSMDYYNLALGGTGVDVMTYNLMMWISTIKKLPKALVIIWPQSTRFARLEDFGDFLSLEVPSCATSTSCERFMVMGEEIRFFETVDTLSKKLIEAAYPCQIMHLGPSVLRLEEGDKARDLSHAGILNNRQVADLLIPQLRS